jgi:hypothetical protein
MSKLKILLPLLLIVAGCSPRSSSSTSRPSLSPSPSPAVQAKQPEAPKAVPRPPKFVTREEWGSEPQPFPDSKKHTPKYVTIHHAGVDYKPGTDPAKFVKNMQGWGQRDKGWPDLPYHFLIAPDGRIFEARDLAYEPDTNTKYPLQGHIGVEMMGNFETQRVSPQQLESCARLVAWLCDRQKIDTSQIATHRDVAPKQTTCPGKDFYRYMLDGQFKQWVQRIMAGQDPQIDPGPPLPGGPTVVVGATTQPATKAATRP